MLRQAERSFYRGVHDARYQHRRKQTQPFPTRLVPCDISFVLERSWPVPVLQPSQQRMRGMKILHILTTCRYYIQAPVYWTPFLIHRFKDSIKPDISWFCHISQSGYIERERVAGIRVEPRLDTTASANRHQPWAPQVYLPEVTTGSGAWTSSTFSLSPLSIPSLRWNWNYPIAYLIEPPAFQTRTVAEAMAQSQGFRPLQLRWRTPSMVDGATLPVVGNSSGLHCMIMYGGGPRFMQYILRRCQGSNAVDMVTLT